MSEPPYGIDDLQALLIELYVDNDTSQRAHSLFIDTLRDYATAIALAASKATCSMLGMDDDSVQMLDLTARQYAKLEASDMLGIYIQGKEETDD